MVTFNNSMLSWQALAGLIREEGAERLHVVSAINLAASLFPFAAN